MRQRWKLIRIRRAGIITLVCAFASITLIGCALFVKSESSRAARYSNSPQFHDGKFQNPVPPTFPGGRELIGIYWRSAFGKSPDTVPSTAPEVVKLTPGQLAAAPDGSIYRLGHSTVLLKLDGSYWLTDPVFAERASPVQWAGPKRFHSPPIAIEDLPNLAAVVLSHDHYDHLDKASVLALSAKTGLFITPLGVGDYLIDWGVPVAKVRQLDWWDATEVQGVSFTATPAQHFSGRNPLFSNPTLWSSWVIKSKQYGIFFSGDTGYFSGLKEIGERFGPFDLTLLETGAYDLQWEGVHMLPEQVIQAHKELRGDWLLPIHNGTFDLGFHAWNEPFERLTMLAQKEDVRLVIPKMGELAQIGQLQPREAWWREQRPRETR